MPKYERETYAVTRVSRRGARSRAAGHPSGHPSVAKPAVRDDPRRLLTVGRRSAEWPGNLLLSCGNVVPREPSALTDHPLGASPTVRGRFESCLPGAPMRSAPLHARFEGGWAAFLDGNHGRDRWPQISSTSDSGIRRRWAPTHLDRRGVAIQPGASTYCSDVPACSCWPPGRRFADRIGLRPATALVVTERRTGAVPGRAPTTLTSLPPRGVARCSVCALSSASDRLDPPSNSHLDETDPRSSALHTRLIVLRPERREPRYGARYRAAVGPKAPTVVGWTTDEPGPTPGLSSRSRRGSSCCR